MTIQEAIELVDRAEPNMVTPEQKIIWLSRLDAQIFREVFLTHEGLEPGASFDGYDEGTDPSTELLVKAPDDNGIYVNYLEAEIHKQNHEIGKYNQSITLFGDAYSTFTSWFNRTHMPVQRNRHFNF